MPLWFAITLKKTKKCNICIPEWIKINNLKQLLMEENEYNEFSNIPFYGFQITKILFLNHLNNDWGNDNDSNSNINKIRLLLNDINLCRNNKLKNGLKSININTYFLKLTNISCIQINKIRSYLSNYLKICYQINHIKNIQNTYSSQIINDDDNDIDYKYNDQINQTFEPSRKLRRLR